LGDNFKTSPRRGTPTQGPPNTKLGPWGKIFMEYNLREIQLEQKSPLEKILSRVEEKMSRESNQAGEGLSNLQPLSEGVVDLPYANHLDSKKWERYQHLGGLSPR
jgi:hypothetical protein